MSGPSDCIASSTWYRLCLIFLLVELFENLSGQFEIGLIRIDRTKNATDQYEEPLHFNCISIAIYWSHLTHSEHTLFPLSRIINHVMQHFLAYFILIICKKNVPPNFCLQVFFFLLVVCLFFTFCVLSENDPAK